MTTGLMSNVDWIPTLLDMAGISVDTHYYGLDGVTMKNWLLEGDEDSHSPRQEIVLQAGQYLGYFFVLIFELTKYKKGKHAFGQYLTFVC